MIPEDKHILDELIEKYGKINVLNEIQFDANREEILGIIREWKNIAKQYFSIVPYINYGKAIQIVKRALKQLSKEQILTVMESYCQWYIESQSKYNIDISIALSGWYINKYLTTEDKYGK
jgi:hypothetical protein